MPHLSDRPTIPPAFDVEQYAKDSDADAEPLDPFPVDAFPNRLPDAPQSEIRLLTRPEKGAGVTNETWAQTRAGAPVVVMTVDLLKRLPLDHRAGFLLSLMDGAMDLETLVEVSGMPRPEVLRVVRDLFESRVVDFQEPA